MPFSHFFTRINRISELHRLNLLPDHWFSPVRACVTAGPNPCRYHTIHHTKEDANFCLFMPLFDLIGGTLDAQSWEMQKKTSAGMNQIKSNLN